MDTRDIKTESDGQDQVRDAFIFARQIADHEIESIERIHKRTLLSFGYIGVFGAALFAFFGYIGYSNLRDASIASARTQMQREVTEQVREKLTTENINQIVQGQLRDLSAASLNAEIHKELTSPPLSSSIRQAADDEAKQQIAKEFLPRHLGPAQARLLIGRLAELKQLEGYPVAVTAWQFDVEATNYAAELRECLSHSVMKMVATANSNKPPVEGLGIYYDERLPDTNARQLQDALQAAGVVAKLVPGIMESAIASPVPGQKIPLELFVGSKAMQ